MKYSLADGRARYEIKGYRPGRIQIGEQVYTSNLLVSANTLISDWGPADLRGLTEEHFQKLLHHRPQLILLGTGPTQIFPDFKRFSPLLSANIGYEIMATDAACRTFNLLLSEGREVLAVLFV